jgi:DNA-binding NarL/FixJ family response regulator
MDDKIIENNMKKNKKIKILLIDDDEMMRIYFRDVFWMHSKNNNYEVLMASNLDEAQKMIEDKETRPDSIFLDVLMSTNKGNTTPAYKIARSLEFISKIKKDKELSNIKIVLYSGHKEQAITDSCEKLGIDGTITKGELMPKEIVAFTDKLHGTNN